MLHVRCLVPFTLLLPGMARRSIRIGDSHDDVQQQANTFNEQLEMTADAREASLPRGFWTALFHRQGLQAGALHAVYGPGAWRGCPLLEQYGRHAGHLELHRDAQSLAEVSKLDAEASAKTKASVPLQRSAPASLPRSPGRRLRISPLPSVPPLRPAPVSALQRSAPVSSGARSLNIANDLANENVATASLPRPVPVTLGHKHIRFQGHHANRNKGKRNIAGAFRGIFGRRARPAVKVGSGGEPDGAVIRSADDAAGAVVRAAPGGGAKIAACWCRVSEWPDVMVWSMGNAWDNGMALVDAWLAKWRSNNSTNHSNTNNNNNNNSKSNNGDGGSEPLALGGGNESNDCSTNVTTQAALVAAKATANIFFEMWKGISEVAAIRYFTLWPVGSQEHGVELALTHSSYLFFKPETFVRKVAYYKDTVEYFFQDGHNVDMELDDEAEGFFAVKHGTVDLKINLNGMVGLALSKLMKAGTFPGNSTSLKRCMGCPGIFRIHMVPCTGEECVCDLRPFIVDRIQLIKMA